MSYSERINNLTNLSRKQSHTPDITYGKTINPNFKIKEKYDPNRASKLSNRQ